MSATTAVLDRRSTGQAGQPDTAQRLRRARVVAARQHRVRRTTALLHLLRR